MSLDTELRSQLTRLSEQILVPDPQRALASVAQHRRHLRWRRRMSTGGLGAVVALAAVAGWLVVRPSDRADLELAGATPPDLVGIEWQLTTLTIDGERQAVADVDAVVRFDGEGHYSGTACNDFYGDVSARGRQLRFGADGSTSMLCTDERGRVERRLGRLFAGDATWALADGTLRIEADGVAGAFRERDTVFPTRDLVVLAHNDGSDGGPQFQFGYRQRDGETVLWWEARDRPGQPWGFMGCPSSVGVDPEPVDLSASGSHGGQIFVCGYLPPSTERAEYRRQGHQPQAIEVLSLPNGNRVFGVFVSMSGGEVVALDASGRDLGRSRTVR